MTDWTEHEFESDPREGKFLRYWFDSLTWDEWVPLLRYYRILRVAFWDKRCGEVQAYGLSRDEARAVLYEFAQKLDWYAYLGSK